MKSEVRFSYLKLKNFKGYTQFEASFSGNPVVVFGPNESGKSSLLEAIRTALFTDASSKSVKVQSLTNLTTGEPPLVELGIKADGEELVITRDFANRRNLLEYRGSVYTNKQDIEKIIRENTGLRDKDLFDIAFSIAQEQISIDSNSFKNALDHTIEQLVTRFNVPPKELMKKLADHTREIELGMKRPAKKPGRLKQIIDRIESLKDERNELEKQLEETRSAAEQAERLSREINELKKRLAELEERKQKLAGAIKLTEDYAEIREQELEKELNQKREERARLLAWLLNTINEKIAAAGEKKQAIRRFKELNARLQDIKELKKKINELEQELKHFPASLERIAKECQQLDAAIAGRMSGTSISFQLELKEANVPVSLKIDGEAVDEITSGQFREKLELETDQLRFEASPIEGKTTSELKHELQEILSGAGFTSITELNGELDRKRKLEIELESLKKKLQEHPDEKDILKEINQLKLEDSSADEETVEAEMNEMRSLAAKYEAIIAMEKIELPEKAGFEKELSIKAADGQLASLNDEIKDLNNQLHELQSGISRLSAGGRTREKVTDEAGIRRKMSFFLTHLRTVYDELGSENLRLDITDPLSSHKELARRLEEIQDEIDKQEGKKNELEKNLSFYRGKLANLPDAGRIIELDEQIEELTAERKKLENKLEVYSLARTVLSEALERFSSQINNEIIQKSEKILESLTGGRYESVVFPEADVDPENARLIDAEKNIHLPARLLSRGAADQFYLALRLALASVITEGRELPVLLDDTFSNFDINRLRNATEHLKSCQHNRQIFIFTCHEHIKELLVQSFTPQLIELS